MSTFKKIALTLLAVALPCLGWAALPDGLQQYYPFTDSNNESGYGATTVNLDGTYISADTPFGAAFGNGLGAGGTFDCEPKEGNYTFWPGMGDFTCAFWQTLVKPTSANRIILSRGATLMEDKSQVKHGWSLWCTTEGAVKLLVYYEAAGTELTTAGTPVEISAPGVFSETASSHHIAWTRSGTTITLYIDGEEKATGELPADNNIGNDNAVWYRALNVNNWKSALAKGEAFDELAFWNRALSEDEVKSLKTTSLATELGKYSIRATVNNSPKFYTTLNEAVADGATAITLLKNSVITENLTLDKCISGAYKLTVKSGVTFTVNAPAYNGKDDTKTFADYTTIETEEDAVVELKSGGGYFSVTGSGTTKVLGDIRYGLGYSVSKTNTISTDLEVAESVTLTLRAWNRCAPLGGGNISVNGRIVTEYVDDNSMDATITIVSGKTLSGKGTIGTTDSGYKAVNVTLASGAILDASEGPITVMGSNSSVSFPEPTDVGGLVSPGIVNVILPEGTTGFPARFIYCTGATEAATQEVSVGVKLKGEDRFLYNDEIVLMVNNTTGLPDGYGVMQYTCIGDGVKYMSVTEAVAAGAKAITLQEDTIENVTIPNGVTLQLSGTISGTHTITGDVTIEDGATLVPLGGSINGNLVFEDNSALTLSMEFSAGEEFPFTVTGAVTFPTASFTITADTSAETVKLGVPRQLIKSGMLLTPGTVYTITNLDVITGDTEVPTNESTKIVTTSTTYELVTTETSAYTFDGVDYDSIEQALEEYKTAMEAGIPNNQTIKLNNVLMPTETIVVDVGEGNTVTFDLTNSGIASYADPAIRIVSGNLALVNNTTTAEQTTVASMVGKAILVGAALENDVVTASDTACGLYIGSYVTVSTENTTAPVVTVDVINGGISGEGVINGNLTLADGSIVDATHGVLSMAEKSTITFPGTVDAKGTIKVMPSAGEPYPSRFIICSTANRTDIANVDLKVILNGSEVTNENFTLVVKYDDNAKPTGYAVNGADIVAISINGTTSEIGTWTQLVDAINDAGPTGQVILTADATIANDYTTNIYTSGHDITLAKDHTLTGTLTLMHGTVVTVPDDVTLTATNIIIDTNAVVTIGGKIASDNPVVNNGILTTSLTFATIDGTLRLTNGSATNGMVSATVGTIVDAGAKATVDGYLYGSLTVQNATVDGEGYILIADLSTWEGATLTGAGTINPTVHLFDGATINKIGYEAAHLVMPKLEALSGEKITVKANDLAHVINTKDTVINAANFTVDMTGSNYVAYNEDDPQAEDTGLVAPVVAKNNGDYTLGIVKINYNLVGVDIKAVGYAQSLAAFAYSYGVLEVMGVYNNREAFQCFSNLNITGFTTGGYANIGDYDFGVTDITVTTETIVTGEGDDAVTTTTPNYVIVTAQVLNTDGTADFRETTNVVVNVNGTAVTATEITEADAATYGLELPEDTTGMKFLLVPYDSVITGEMTDGSKTAKITVKAVSAITTEEVTK